MAEKQVANRIVFRLQRHPNAILESLDAQWHILQTAPTEDLSVTSEDTLLHPAVFHALNQYGIEHRVVACDDALADTAAFCKEYGYEPEQSANALVVASTKGEPVFACCVVLANCRLDVNKVVRKKLGAKKVSFANPEVTREMTGMELGGVTPVGIPETLPLWIDSRVMECAEIILGGGNRSSKLLLPPAGLAKMPQAEVVEGLAKLIDSA